VGKLLLLHQTSACFAKEFTHNRLQSRNSLSCCNTPGTRAECTRLTGHSRTPTVVFLFQNEICVSQLLIRKNHPLDPWLSAADVALRTLFATPVAAEVSPAAAVTEGALRPEERRLSGALMRVNHVGEVCAQALYTAQATVTRDAGLREHLREAAREETDHLAWTRARLDALGARPSVLNPLWYAGAFALGAVTASVSDRVSLGFVVETENQVSAHLGSHLQRLPADDLASRAVVARMKADEERHAAQARAAGALELPFAARALMRAAARVMTGTAHHL
jgi:3-demethoxyubiquinol 3-hydroxylase